MCNVWSMPSIQSTGCLILSVNIVLRIISRGIYSRTHIATLTSSSWSFCNTTRWPQHQHHMHLNTCSHTVDWYTFEHNDFIKAHWSHLFLYCLSHVTYNCNKLSYITLHSDLYPSHSTLYSHITRYITHRSSCTQWLCILKSLHTTMQWVTQILKVAVITLIKILFFFLL